MHVLDTRMEAGDGPAAHGRAPAEVLERYVGVYEADGTRAEIARLPGRPLGARAGLANAAPRGGRVEVLRAGARCAGRLRVGSGGAATGALLRQAGRKVRYRKIA